MAHIRGLEPFPVSVQHRRGKAISEGPSKKPAALAPTAKLVVGNPQKELHHGLIESRIQDGNRMSGRHLRPNTEPDAKNRPEETEAKILQGREGKRWIIPFRPHPAIQIQLRSHVNIECGIGLPWPAAGSFNASKSSQPRRQQRLQYLTLQSEPWIRLRMEKQP